MSESSDVRRMRIGELAALTGASTRSLRHYENFDLLQTHRTENGYRHYPKESVERVKAIRFLLASGLKLTTIAEILPAIMHQHCKLADPRVRSVIAYESTRIKAQIDELTRSYDLLISALKKGVIRQPLAAD